MDLNGTAATAAVTGGGLGSATAKHSAAKRAQVAVSDLDLEAADVVANKISGNVVAAAASDEVDVDAAFTDASETLGQAPLDAVNRAGIRLAPRIVARDSSGFSDVFEEALKVDPFCACNVINHAARRMIAPDPANANENGVTINTASVASEFARAGVWIMATAPRPIKAPMMGELPQEVAGVSATNIPFPLCLGDLQKHTFTAVQIDASTYLNGTTIRLDGAVRLPSE